MWAVRTASKRVKYLGMTLPRETQSLCSEYQAPLLEDIDGDLSKWKGTLTL